MSAPRIVVEDGLARIVGDAEWDWPTSAAEDAWLANQRAWAAAVEERERLIARYRLQDERDAVRDEEQRAEIDALRARWAQT